MTRQSLDLPEHEGGPSRAICLVQHEPSPTTRQSDLMSQSPQSYPGRRSSFIIMRICDSWRVLALRKRQSEHCHVSHAHKAGWRTRTVWSWNRAFSGADDINVPRCGFGQNARTIEGTAKPRCLTGKHTPGTAFVAENTWMGKFCA